MAYCTCPEWMWWWRIWLNEDWQRKPKYSEKTCPSATLSTTNPTWPDPGSNSGRCCGKAATNRLSSGAACAQFNELCVAAIRTEVQVQRSFLNFGNSKGRSSDELSDKSNWRHCRGITKTLFEVSHNWNGSDATQEITDKSRGWIWLARHPVRISYGFLPLWRQWGAVPNVRPSVERWH
jgi:hypothetical protein